ncbi:MAG: hypothetical protein SFU99_02430 [Saprospiraceae bacterium]|nr:hypothetical protein [Saprospiraceae bacterium]
MNFPKAILDTSALRSLYYLELLPYLNLLYTEIRIPRAVEKEFLVKPSSESERTSRFIFLSNFYLENSSWFIPCNEYGSDLVEIYLAKAGMHEGEAEVLAQNQFFDNLYEVILDERIARKFASSENMSIHGTLYLLAFLDIKFRVCNYFTSVDLLMSKRRTFLNVAIIRKAYEDVKIKIFG